MIVAIIGVAVGLFFWFCARPDVMRWRDWRLATGRYGGVAIMGPAMLRVGAAALVLFVGGILLYHAIDNADFDSWLYD